MLVYITIVNIHYPYTYLELVFTDKKQVALSPTLFLILDKTME